MPEELVQLDRSKRLLNELEWAGSEVHYTCPKCHRDRGHGHEKGCLLAELIGVQ